MDDATASQIHFSIGFAGVRLAVACVAGLNQISDDAQALADDSLPVPRVAAVEARKGPPAKSRRPRESPMQLM